MFQLIRLLGRAYKIFWGLVVMAFLGVTAWLMWHGYQAERRQSQFRAEGRPITVEIDHTDRKPREVWDALGNFVYVGFAYRNQRYETRFVNDTLWLSKGDRIELRYHPRWNAFEQLKPTLKSNQTRVVSRLINWTVVREFKPENTLLAGFVIVVISLFFFGGGVLVSLTGWTIIQDIARLALIIALGAGALFFTYNAIQYYRYVDDLRTNGRDTDVVVLDTDRVSAGRRSSWRTYTYHATFRFQGRERVVLIEETDYERINSGDNRLTVRYAKALDDFIPVAYSPGLTQLIPPGFLWLLVILFTRNGSVNRHRRLAVPPPGSARP
ncbi:MAG: hypothetical protein H7Z75_06050 [Ferruginibacter sp.]|nr:hypothetical protein [Cytophagales bacterium]